MMRIKIEMKQSSALRFRSVGHRPGEQRLDERLA